MAILIVTVIIGQLAAEVCATGSMLDFINTPVMIVTTWLCLSIEASGLLHAVYLVQHAAEYCSRSSSSSNDTSQNKSVDDDSHDDDIKKTPPSNMESKSASGHEKQDASTKIFFCIRVMISCVLLFYTCGVTLTALLNYQTTMYEGVSSYVSIAILLFLICFLGIMEAMQIALFAVVNLPKKSIDFDRYSLAKINCDLAFKGSNFQAFLIGRQICVTMSMFLLARVTTTCYQQPTVLGDHDDAVGFNSQKVEDFFNTGLPGAFITTVIASLAWRIFGSCFPMEFMNSPIVYPTIRLCLFLESTGIFSAAWVSATWLRTILRLQPDEDYIGPLLNSKEISASSTDEETVSQTSSFSSI